jgi:hypothetical protein
MRVLAAAVVVLSPILGALPSAAQPPSAVRQVVDVPTRPNVTVRYLATQRFLGGGRVPVALVLLAGGNGLLQVSTTGQIGTSLRLNFLIRSREQFLLSGAALVVAVDAPSDRPQGMDGAFRLSDAHAQDLQMVMQDVRTRFGHSVWLVGTSSGTISVANAASRGLRGPHAGVVFTATQTRRVTGLCGRTVFDATLATIRTPALVVSHRGDACYCSPAADADAVLAALTASMHKEKKIFTGGSRPVSGKCEARSQHGFYGIEKAVTDYIVRRIELGFQPPISPFR